jgi:hypothetical protein
VCCARKAQNICVVKRPPTSSLTKRLLQRCCSTFYDCRYKATLWENIHCWDALFSSRAAQFAFSLAVDVDLSSHIGVAPHFSLCALCEYIVELARSIFVFRRAAHNLYFPWPSPSFSLCRLRLGAKMPSSISRRRRRLRCAANSTCTLQGVVRIGMQLYHPHSSYGSILCMPHCGLSACCIFGSTNSVLNPINRPGKCVSREKNPERVHCFVTFKPLFSTTAYLMNWSDTFSHCFGCYRVLAFLYMMTGAAIMQSA